MKGINKLRNYKGNDLTELAECFYNLETGEDEYFMFRLAIMKYVKYGCCGFGDWFPDYSQPSHKKNTCSIGEALDWIAGCDMDGNHYCEVKVKVMRQKTLYTVDVELHIKYD